MTQQDDHARTDEREKAIRHNLENGWFVPEADVVYIVAQLDAAKEREVKLKQALCDADDCIQEEFNLSNYDHETVCRIATMWDEAHGIIRAAAQPVRGEET